MSFLNTRKYFCDFEVGKFFTRLHRLVDLSWQVPVLADSGTCGSGLFLGQRSLDSSSCVRTLVGHRKVDHRISEIVDLILRHCFTERHGLVQQKVLEHFLALVASEGLVPVLAAVHSACEQLRVIAVKAIELDAVEVKERIALSQIILDYKTVRQADALEVGFAGCAGVAFRQTDVVSLIERERERCIDELR